MIAEHNVESLTAHIRFYADRDADGDLRWYCEAAVLETLNEDQLDALAKTAAEVLYEQQQEELRLRLEANFAGEWPEAAS